MHYHDHLDSHRDMALSSEREFLMDEYRTRFGCAPPLALLVGLSPLVANALLTRAILLKRPLKDATRSLHAEQRLSGFPSVSRAGTPEGMADFGLFTEPAYHTVEVVRVGGG